MDIPHIVQKTNWDCGIACIEMILRYNLGENYKEGHLENVCESLGFDESVWSIDLAHVLVKCDIECVYHTITHGVDPGYKNEDFYQDCFTKDEKRVNEHFENAQELGLNVVKGTVSTEDICSKLSQGYVAIVLIDSMKLHCNHCEPLTNLVHTHQPFCGHYILLCGYEGTIMSYKNPSTSQPLCYTNISCFECAWHSYGTDDDIIFIKLDRTIHPDSVLQ